MKSRRRHELKENVLAQELGKLKELFSKYGNWILVGVAVVAIVLLVARHYLVRGRARRSEEIARYEKLITDEKVSEPERLAGLTALAETAEDPVLAVSSAMWAGDFCCEKYLTALHESQPAEAEEYRRKAEGFYEMVISGHPERKPFVAKAYLGLGILCENAGDFAAADQHYDRVSQLVPEGFPAAREAKRRKRLHEVWSRPVRFATTQPATSTAPATAAAPQTEPAGERAGEEAK